MKHNDNPTPFYIRTRMGETFYCDTLEEALEEFCGPTGYRLTLSSDHFEVVVRRNRKGYDPFEGTDIGVNPMLGPLLGTEYGAGVIVRTKP